jgi:hypothetical protein
MTRVIKKWHYWVLAALLLCIMWGCKKQPGTVAIDADLEKNFSYKPGTYWIYRDSLTGEVDSFAVVDNHDALGNSNNFGNYTIQSAEIGTYHNGIANDTFLIRWDLQTNYVNYTYYKGPSFSGGSLQYNPLFYYPFKRYSILPTYSVGSNIFSNVAEIATYPNGYFKAFPDVFYICANAGIIKMNLSDSGFVNRVWELQYCNIVH